MRAPAWTSVLHTTSPATGPATVLPRETKFYTVECHTTCANCTGSLKSSCASCPSGKLLWNGYCLSDCPAGTYLDSSTGSSNCTKCEPQCQTCASATSCLSCSANYFAQDGTDCVATCADGKYADKGSGKCESCPEACLTCRDGSNCIECNSAQGFIRGSDGSCIRLVCPDGTFLLKSGAKCIACDSSCLTCSGSSSNECITCAAGTVAYPSLQNRYQCKACNKVSAGLYAGSDGTCQGTLPILLASR